ncbi:hypothetical protein, partial [Serratia sp. SSNIH2]|uniref:hypothetical protein n=1 Tax=Serratia sp. SSNIH2 TaxID=2080493 RepID=UPI001E4AAD35
TLPLASITNQSRWTSCGLATKVFMMVPKKKNDSAGGRIPASASFPRLGRDSRENPGISSLYQRPA